MFDYNAKVLRVVDGDTVEVELDLGFHIKYKNTVRLAGINTQEINDKDPVKRTLARDAKYFVEKLLPKDTTVIVYSKSLDKYGRILGDVVVNNQNISTLLLENKLAERY